jgi:hypothetical protein
MNSDKINTHFTSDDAVGATSFTERTNVPFATTCAICLTEFGPAESKMVCPACGQAYHDDCWQENLGCGVYGCAQVNALKTEAEIRIAVPTAGAPAAAIPPAGLHGNPPVSAAASVPTALNSWRPTSLWHVSIGMGGLLLSFPMLIAGIGDALAGPIVGSLISGAAGLLILVAGLGLWPDETPAEQDWTVVLQRLSRRISNKPWAAVIAAATVWLLISNSALGRIERLSVGAGVDWANEYGFVVFLLAVSGRILLKLGQKTTSSRPPGAPAQWRDQENWQLFSAWILTIAGGCYWFLSFVCLVEALERGSSRALGMAVIQAVAGWYFVAAGRQSQAEPTLASPASPRRQIVRAIAWHPWGCLCILGWFCFLWEISDEGILKTPATAARASSWVHSFGLVSGLLSFVGLFGFREIDRSNER